MRAASSRLGVERTRFVGRSSDLHAPAERLGSGARLVTVLGPPGIGKTRLARELANAHKGKFLGGAWFCELADARTADDLVRTIARTLRITVDRRASAARVELARALD